jgi:uncharacterized membrane protein
MSKMLVVVFDQESQAFEASKALAELHRDGYISAFAGAIVARDAAGNVSVKDDVDEGPIGTALGMMTGAMIGLLAGPEGVLAGAAIGSMMGATADLVNIGVGVDFVNDVSAHLEPGKVALIAEINEYWTTPVDTKMAALGGTVIRRNRVDVEDEQIQREIAAERAEWEDLKAEMQQANEEDKAKLQAKVDSARQKLADAGERAKAKLSQIEEEGDAKLEAIEKQLAEARAENKAKLEQRKTELKQDYAERSTKLKQGWELTKEALAA